MEMWVPPPPTIGETHPVEAGGDLLRVHEVDEVAGEDVLNDRA